MIQLPPQYNPHDVETRLYQQWEANGFFHAEPDANRTPYTIVIPPPNVTGILHMGHALNNTIQDVLIRWKRMQGFNALWIPGTDHAGIATQNVVEKSLAREGKRRQDLGREAFVQRVWAWKEQYGNTIINQLKRLGASCDWSRTRFTMDEGLSDAVTEVFIRLYKKGLIYRGNYIINWCPRCQTALSDEEAPRKETHGKLYYIKYPLKPCGMRNAECGIPKKSSTPHPAPRTPHWIVVATTRPETMLGDTAIAVHPKDKRYKALIGKTAVLPLVNRELPIIADEAIDPEFGTGAVKVTPAHDPVDFQLGKRHGLEFVNVMTDDGHMVNVPQPYHDFDRFECRNRLLSDLEEQGLLEKVEDHLHGVGRCYRCDTVVEPRLSLQWFVKMKPLTKPAIEAVKKKRITFTPARWTKVYLNWMENIQDWCISRQIWWGHRLPVYYCQTCTEGSREQGAGSRKKGGAGNVIVSKTRPEKCPRCGSTNLKQDEDVLDTWFSSWLWPFSTLGWPKKTKDFAYFYPTDALVTAPEIIFFWVARMIMAGTFCMKAIPFKQVYIHGTVRDLTGKKMSKSLGNIIDPLEIIEQFGADALRYTLVTSTAIGTDVFISEDKFAVGRNFANKLWNATRYVLTAMRDAGCGMRDEGLLYTELRTPHSALSAADRWILSRLQQTITQTTKDLERFAFHEAAHTVYEFLWHDVCDWYLELSKLVQGSQRSTALAVLTHVLETSLRLLHPVMPFVTDALWQQLSGKADGSIMTTKWPVVEKRWIDREAEAHMALFKTVVTAIRNTKAELNVPMGARPSIHLATKRLEVRRFFEAHRPFLQSLARVGEIAIDEVIAKPRDAAATVVDGVEVIMPLAGLIDPHRERQRLQSRVNELTNELARLDARLNDQQFIQRAPREVIDGIKAKRPQLEETLKKLSGHLHLLESLQ